MSAGFSGAFSHTQQQNILWNIKRFVKLRPKKKEALNKKVNSVNGAGELWRSAVRAPLRRSVDNF